MPLWSQEKREFRIHQGSEATSDSTSHIQTYLSMGFGRTFDWTLLSRYKLLYFSSICNRNVYLCPTMLNTHPQKMSLHCFSVYANKHQIHHGLPVLGGIFENDDLDLCLQFQVSQKCFSTNVTNSWYKSLSHTTVCQICCWLGHIWFRFESYYSLRLC